MAGIIPNIPGSGNNIPVSTYVAGISESYPNVNRQRVVETSINSKEKVDFLPVNMGVNNSLLDKYIEFRINGIPGSFIDLASLLLELVVKPVNVKDGSDVGGDVNIALVNGLSNTLFKSVSVFINEKMVESNPLYNYTAYMKFLKSMNANNINTIGKCGFFYDDENSAGVTKTYAADTFTTATNIEHKLMSSIKSDGVATCFPLLLDIASLDMYLLDNVDVRIRLETASNAWLIKSNSNPSGITLNINKAKLWVDRVTPHYNALTALNHSLTMKPLEYIFQKQLHKTYVVGTGESSIMIDQPFAMCIPEKLNMVILDMASFSGLSTQNGLYFNHCNLTNIHITVNGATAYNISPAFPNNYTQCYYETQKSVGIDKDNMLSFSAYKSGRSLFSFNFINEPVEETLPIEVSANLRLSLRFAASLTSPHVIILVAETTGLLSVDNQRNVTCDVRG